MKRLRVLPRWFKRRFGYARLLCLALLIGFAALRVADPAPVEEIRVRTFDAFQRIDPRKKTVKAGHHRRHRRQEPGKARAVAVAAHPDCRPRHRTDPARRGRDRVRRGVFGARPSQPRLCGRHLPQSRRGNPRQAARAAEQRPGLRRRHQGVARRARRIRPAGGNRRARQDAAGHRARDARRGAAALHVRFPRPAAQRAGAGACRRRARPVHDPARARRHRAAGADDHAGAGPDHAVADLRDAARRHRLGHDPDQGRARPASRASASRAFRFRPTTTASSGFTMPATIPRSMSPRSTCWRRTSRPT